MARLNVSEARNGTVIYNEVLFRKVDSLPQKGDIARVVKPWGMQVEGCFYPVINEDHKYYEDGDEIVYIDGEEHHASHLVERVEVFRDARAVVKPGDRIVVTSGYLTCGQYRNGDVFTVKQISDGGGCVYVDEIDTAISHSEYDVLPALKAGDKVTLLSGGGIPPLFGFHDGKTYTVKAMPEDHRYHAGKGLIQIMEDGVRIGFAKPEQLALAVEASPETLKPGDYAVVVNAHYVTMRGFEDGEIVKVTEEEIEAVTKKPERLKKGDSVRVVRRIHGHDFEIGAVVRIKAVTQDDYLAESVSGAKWWVTDEEIEALGQSFQPGDIVLVSYYFDKYYGEVVSGKDSDGEYLVSNGEEEEYIDERDLTMIAPKGNRVD